MTNERSLLARLRSGPHEYDYNDALMAEAADEIERLQAALKWSEQRRWNTKMAMEVVVYAVAGDDQAQLISAYESRLQELRSQEPTAVEPSTA